MEHDFVVGSLECKLKLMRLFPDASILHSPYVENPTTVYAIKKFDAMDLLKESQKRRNKMARTFCYNEYEMFSEIEKFVRLQKEYQEQTLAEIIQKYDFIVGSMELKLKLIEVLPDGTNIVYSPYIESPTTVYAIKKFDVTYLLIDSLNTESTSQPNMEQTGTDSIYDYNPKIGNFKRSKLTFQKRRKKNERKEES